MKPRIYPLLVCCLVVLSGCGSLLASMNADSIEDRPRERTIAQMIEDENIETKVTVNIHAENEAYHDSNLTVVSYNGYVLIAGQVNDEVLKAGATSEAKRVKGVRRIYNELEIGPPTSAWQRTTDTWITGRIKSELLANSDIDGSTVKVVTENSVVYLMGIVTPEEAEQIATIAAGVSGVERVVRLFEPMHAPGMQ